MTDPVTLDRRAFWNWRALALWGARGVCAVLVGALVAGAIRRHMAGMPGFDHAVGLVLLCAGAVLLEALLRRQFRNTHILGWVNQRLHHAESHLSAPQTAAQTQKMLQKSPVLTLVDLAAGIGAVFVCIALLAAMAVVSRLGFACQSAVLCVTAGAYALSAYPGAKWAELWVTLATVLPLVGTLGVAIAGAVYARALPPDSLAILVALSLAHVFPVLVLKDVLPAFASLRLETFDAPNAQHPRRWAEMAELDLGLPDGAQIKPRSGAVTCVIMPNDADRRALLADWAQRSGAVAPVFNEAEPFVPPVDVTQGLPAPLTLDKSWPGGICSDLTRTAQQTLAINAAFATGAPVVAIDWSGPRFGASQDHAILGALCGAASQRGGAVVIVAPRPVAGGDPCLTSGAM